MNQMEIIRKELSPLWLKVIASIIFLATAYKMVTLTFFNVHPLVYIILNAIAMAIWTGKDLVVIDFDKGTIGDGFRILGITYLDKSNFTGIEKIFINRINMVETFRPLTRSVDIHHVNYKAFLKTFEGEKICVGISIDKDKLIEKLRDYNKVLKVNIFDTTQPQESVQVD